MVATLFTRGPDDSGALVRPRVALGVRRLAVIDLANGHQPISNEDESVHVVLNGELYDHDDLRRELMLMGHRFRTRSDTEILVHGFEEWGIARLLQRLNGMFAFALYDERNATTYVARDRIGIKPLVYAHGCDTLYFASTIRALVASGHVPVAPDPLGIRLYIKHQFVPGVGTAIDGVQRVPPASYLAIRGGRVEPPRTYWSLPHGVDEKPGEAEWEERLREVLHAAVKRRMRADVSVGVFLSGGLDSSIVAGIMAQQAGAPVHAFTVGFGTHAGFDETPFARNAARRFGATLHHAECTPEQFARQAMGAAACLNEPVGDPACVPLLALSEVAAQHVTVVLSGEGADELFSGYGYYRRIGTRRARLLDQFKRVALGRTASAFSGYPYAMSAKQVQSLTPRFADAGNVGLVTQNLEKQWAGPNRRDRLHCASRVDIQGFLADDLLGKVDSTTMHYSLEARVPFLDHHVVETAMSMPGGIKRTGREGKKVLRRAFAPLIGTELAERNKHGFAVPLSLWFRGPMRSLLEDLGGRVARDLEWLDAVEVRRLIDAHLAGRDRSRVLWNLLVLTGWYRSLEQFASQTHGRVLRPV